MSEGDGQTDLNLGPESESGKEVSLPPVVPPQTKAPAQINQQINIQQLPPKAWERLSPEQIVDLAKNMMTQIEKMDERHYQWATNQANRDERSDQRKVYVGGAIAALGLIAAAYLSATGHETVAAILGVFLATILAVIVGSRLSWE